MLCLDTNIVIALIARRDHRVGEKFRAALAKGVALPVHVAIELWYGVWNSGRVQENTERLSIFFNAPIQVLPFDADDAREAGEIRAHLKRAGTAVDAYDVLIAAQARRRGATLATANATEFTQIPGLVVEDWG